MELILKEGLPHQQKAIDLVCDAFTGVQIDKPSFYYMNPAIDIKCPRLLENIKNIQEKIHPNLRGSSEINGYLNLDIKMETGTGKTYVYTNTIFEMHKRFGINKFIIAVPSLPIKAGTGQFISDEYVKKHFQDVCKYGTEIDLQILESLKIMKGKRIFPSVVREFVKGSSQNKNKIFVLLVNMHLLTDKKNTLLVRDDYDYGVEGFYCPADAIKATKPVVIIDEPHRFSKDQKTFEFIKKRLSPQCIIRYGATFSAVEIGRGRNKVTVKDYHNLIYDLNACDSFNLKLIKGIAKEHFEPLSHKEDKIRIASIESKTSVTFHYFQRDKETKIITLHKNDQLSYITESLNGIYINGIGTNYIELSNGQKKNEREEFSTDIYSSSYSEQMIRLALERHFEVEKANFNRKFKIKTLALFFIDDINSYRKDEATGKEPYLLNCFERLLAERIDLEFDKLTNDDDPEYREYLIATKRDISVSHGGYFSQDNSDSDEEIAKEVSEILYEKKKLLSLRNQDGSYNTRRFLFSKWTLKEGWDNPNVFTITKLRSSGSENTKLQEVGRGLRLPVDENGNRISNEDFTLNYIVDFTEADFAEKLVEQINGELPAVVSISEESIQNTSNKLGITKNDLFKKLILNDYIDMDRNINMQNREKFFAEYPSFSAGVGSDRVKDNNKVKPKPVKIRKAVFSELKDLWVAITQKYLLYYDEFENNFFENEILKLFDGIFTDVIMTSHRDVVKSDNGLMTINEDAGVQYAIEKTIPYNEFLKRINIQTKIAISVIHNALLQLNAVNPFDSRYINEYSATNFIRNFIEWKGDNLRGRFRYEKCNLKVNATALTNKDGTPKEQITQGRVGMKFVEGEPSAKYLYDTIAFDSPLEKNNILTDIEEIVVYGKIPRNSICIPTTLGESYSPDFMYVVKKSNGEKSLNIVVETKDVEGKTELRGTEKIKIECAKKFFEKLKIDGFEVKFYTQLNNKKAMQIITEALQV